MLRVGRGFARVPRALRGMGEFAAGRAGGVRGDFQAELGAGESSARFGGCFVRRAGS